jgi:ubiquinone/menaquinone biosynthesis C-methylase UbiE
MTKVFEAEATVQKWDDDYYTPISRQLYDRAVSDMLKTMGPPPEATILDAGCGPGVHSIRAAKAGYSVHAIDISRTMLDHARQRVAQTGFTDRVRFEQMDLTKLSLADASIDYAFSWGVIIHIPEAERAFEELARVIRPGGRLGLYLTNRSAIDHKLERLARGVLRKPLNVAHLPLGDGVTYRMNGEDLWVWQFDSPALVNHLSGLGFDLLYRRSGEFSEAQRRFSGTVRNLLLRANNLAYTLRAPASLAVSNLYVFERRKSD